MNNITLEKLIHPDREFSPMPFWFWNDSFDEAKIVSQIQKMYSKGVNGFVIHPRIGIPRDIPYMSDKYLHYVKCAVEEADRLGMKVILYDEGMYPSGSAHGMIVKKHPDFASRGIRCEESTKSVPCLSEGERLVFTFTAKKISDNALDRASIKEYKGGALDDGCVFLHLIEGFSHGHIRGIHIGEDDWENPPSAADILRRESVECFIELTHERYYNALSKYFGNTVIGIFTDEPSVLGRGEDKRMNEWTIGFAQELKNVGVYSCDIVAMWYDVGEETAKIRKKYAKAVCNRLENSFYKPLFEWCNKHNIALVGHPRKSADIGFLKYFHIPGQDLVFRKVAPEDDKAIGGIDSIQAKCSSDAARHRGQRRNLNECFACGGRNGIEWAFNADDMKWTMDWLFVRGVNMLVPHAFFYSLDGERRFGERPPDVGFNNIWWKYYGIISDYMKRMSFMMTDSVNVTNIAILCESNRLPIDIAKPLYENQIEFNYLEEELINDGSCDIGGGKIKIKSQCYDTLIIDDVSLISQEIKDFASDGGKVIAYNPTGAELSKNIISVASFKDIPAYLKRDLVVYPSHNDLRVSHIVKNGEHFYVLVNEGEAPIIGDVTILADSSISVFDPWEGKEITDNVLSLYRRESLIICAGKNPVKRTVLHFEDKLSTPKAETELKDWYINSQKTELGSWTENERFKDFCGTLSYQSDFDISLDGVDKIVLDMGSVAEQAEVYINGTYAGFSLWAPYQLDITDYVKDGKNSIKIEVTNSLANKYTSHRLPSGLLGTVTLKIY